MNKMAKNSGNIDYNVNNFLLTYRVTTHATTDVAPSQSLMGRKLRTRLDLIHPRVKEVSMMIKIMLLSRKEFISHRRSRKLVTIVR